MQEILTMGFIATILVAIVFIYFIDGVILLITAVSRVPFLNSARKAAFRLTTGLVSAHFIFTSLLYYIFSLFGGDKYLVLNYPFIDTLSLFEKFFPLFIKHLGHEGSMGRLMQYKLFELVVLWGLLFILFFILNLVIPPLRRLLSAKKSGSFKVFTALFITFALIIIIAFTGNTIFNRIRSIDIGGIKYFSSFNNTVNKDIIYVKEFDTLDYYRQIYIKNKIKISLYKYKYSKVSPFRDNGDKIVLTTYGINPDGLTYLVNNGIDWEVETIDEGNRIGVFSSLVLDHNNNAHISYLDNNSKKVKYATNISGKWRYLTLDKESDRQYKYTDIALDDNKSPYICSYERNTGGLVLYSYINNKWKKEIIDRDDSLDIVDLSDKYEYISLDIEIDNNKVNICYYSPKHNEIRYAKRDNGEWYISSIADTKDHSFDFSLDQDGNGHLVFNDLNRNLYYATNTGGEWSVKTIKNIKSKDSAILIGENNAPYIYYRDARSGKSNLKMWSAKMIFP